jgi:hypothetical protein
MNSESIRASIPFPSPVLVESSREVSASVARRRRLDVDLTMAVGFNFGVWLLVVVTLMVAL